MPKHDFDFPNYYAAHEVESDTGYEAGASLNPFLKPDPKFDWGRWVLTLNETNAYLGKAPLIPFFTTITLKLC
jgi:hypothetical protein